MKKFNNIISLNYNKRGVYSLDPIMGCSSGIAENPMGCYDDCFSAKYAKRYGYDYSKTVFRNFRNRQHLKEIIQEIKHISFIRMGTSGDPSENWDHTIKICRLISPLNEQLNIFNKVDNKYIVIITKHWNALSDNQLTDISKLNICINTSVAAIDKPEKLKYRLIQYNRIKPYCKSVLRIVSFKFNIDNIMGLKYHKIQDKLFNNEMIVDNVFRPSPNNYLIKNNIIHAQCIKFLDTKVLMSKYNKKTFVGYCKNCPEQCGLNLF